MPQIGAVSNNVQLNSVTSIKAKLAKANQSQGAEEANEAKAGQPQSAAEETSEGYRGTQINVSA